MTPKSALRIRKGEPTEIHHWSSVSPGLADAAAAKNDQHEYNDATGHYAQIFSSGLSWNFDPFICLKSPTLDKHC